MKRIIIFFLFILGGKLFSQDQLFKKDNSKYDVKVLGDDQALLVSDEGVELVGNTIPIIL